MQVRILIPCKWKSLKACSGEFYLHWSGRIWTVIYNSDYNTKNKSRKYLSLYFTNFGSILNSLVFTQITSIIYRTQQINSFTRLWRVRNQGRRMKSLWIYSLIFSLAFLLLLFLHRRRTINLWIWGPLLTRHWHISMPRERENLKKMQLQWLGWARFML